VLGSLDELAHELTEAWMTSVVYVVVDVGDRRITLGVAGHPPPLLLQPGRRPQWLDECVGPPLGVERGRRVTASVVYDGPARLVLYTDGLVERRDQPIDVGLARLRDAAYGLLDVEGDEFLDRLVAEMAPEAEQQDDIAVLCADLGR
jgi:serine phosphatase RsbU (regulator of sigma subunit)